ncbi:protein kinase C-binding protein NELL1-like isoform X2 [Babylonia areolata]|uniref:protein kinase C-binding protein NELL1-like isoform X2 n=1 Tax=Babylonia areolata TaxID=304850 RepID=UPI003FD4DEB2
MRKRLAKGLTCAVLHFMVLLHIGSSLSQSPPQHAVLDLLQSLNNTDRGAAGFRYTTGPNPHTPAILLQAATRHVAVPEATALAARRLWESGDDVTFLATIRQELGDSGSIISFSSSVYRYVELESSGRRDEVRLHYTHQQQARVETFPYRLADGRWHRLALTLSGSRVTLLVNCSQIYSRVLRQPVDRTFPASHTPSSRPIHLFLGQRNGQHALFRGALQDVKIVTQAHGYLLQCPHQNTDCPTCSQYQALEKEVQEMSRLYKNVSEENGTVECRSVTCPPAACKNPVYRDGQCCPVCLTNCIYDGKYYDHGETLSPRVCVTCTCDNGQTRCKRVNRETSCPPLSCPPSERLEIQNQCCPVCKGTDFCATGHDCHQNASCVNMATQYACQCNPGFRGDGKHCQDIDECSTEGGKFGHHCHTHTVCVNTPGSYSCQCRQGYRRLDAYTCQEALPTSQQPSSASSASPSPAYSSSSTTSLHMTLLLLLVGSLLGWRLPLCLPGLPWGAPVS